MEYRRFVEEAAGAVREKSGRDVELTAVRKNNGVDRDGLIIREKGRDVSPVIFLDSYYRCYLDGRSMEWIASDIYAVCLNNRAADGFDAGRFMDFERVRQRIVFRLVNYGMNRELLREIPHRKHLDLAAVFCFLAGDTGDGGQMSVLIRNEHLAYWNVSAEDVAGLAYENTPRLLERRFIDMGQMMGLPCKDEAGSCRGILGTGGVPGMTALTNRSGINGAACILYPGILKEFADQADSNIVILPSSIHEVILIPVKGSSIPDRDGFCRMIREVNEAEVGETEVLSDHPYFYDRDAERLSAA